MKRHQEIEICAFDEVDYTYTFTKEELEEYKKEYATQIVLDKLPNSTEIINNCPASSINTREQWFTGVVWMKNQATQRITTREEVEKPYRELLEECRAYNMPPSLRQRINQLLNP